MKKSEKKMIAIIIIIGVIVIGGILVTRNLRNKNNNEDETNEVKEEFVSVLEDGTKLNISNQLAQAKKVNSLDLTNFQLTTKNNVTVLLGTITNNTNQTVGEFEADVKILDKQGNELATFGLLVGALEAGASTQLNTSAPRDYANAYDFEIIKR
jgi:cell division protein YceG involved in septum cleavage